ncbi:MAG: hypothetical protein ACHQRJ_12695 [Alphaproteobacteria bacterium]
MLLIVNSMPKCGSTWFHDYVVRCLSAVGHPTARQATAGRPITLNDRDNPGSLEGEVLQILLDAARSQTFAVKAHVPSNRELVAALRGSTARAVFLIRHPADVVRSSLAYGEDCRRAGREEPYANFYRAEDAAAFVEPFVTWAERWLALGGAGRVIRYEHLFAADENILAAIHELAPDTDSVAAEILEDMGPQNLSQPERDRLRVNLVRRPDIGDGVAAACDAWARRLGYP